MLNDYFQTREVVGSDVDTADFQLNLYTSVVYAFLVIAGIFVIVAFFGCCGAWKVNPALTSADPIFTYSNFCGHLPSWDLVVVSRNQCYYCDGGGSGEGETKQAAPLLKLLYYWSSHSICTLTTRPPPGLFSSMILTIALLTTATITSVYIEDFQENKCMLGTYFLLITILLIGLLVKYLISIN